MDEDEQGWADATADSTDAGEPEGGRPPQISDLSEDDLDAFIAARVAGRLPQDASDDLRRVWLAAEAAIQAYEEVQQILRGDDDEPTPAELNALDDVEFARDLARRSGASYYEEASWGVGKAG